MTPGHPDMQGSVAAPLPLDAEVSLSPANQIRIPSLPERTPMGHQVYCFKKRGLATAILTDQQIDTWYALPAYIRMTTEVYYVNVG